MPDNRILQKAGRIFFLLVCLFLCSACGQEKMKFTAEDSVKETLFSEPEEPEEPENLLKSEEYGNSTASDEQESERRLVDINTASREELMTLPWIGEVRAEAIISYRETSGKFQTIEEVMNVRGIKEGIFNKISKLICVK